MNSVTFSAAAEQAVSKTFRPCPQRLLDIDADSFSASFNRRPFTVSHHLAGHPLFALPRLIELSRRLPEDHVAYNAGDISVDTGLYLAPRTGLSIEETIRRIEDCRSWMVLKFVEQDPDYRDLLDHCLDEIQTFSEPLAPGMCKREGFIFISSPLSVTPYHMDPEYNFLLQVRGTKSMNVLDGSDRSILSEQELEMFFSEGERKMAFKEEYRQKASVFELTPGMGVHVPVTAPHWVENGPGVSVSFSITFRAPDIDRRSIVYSVNSRLRKLGLKPSPFGRSAILDSAKFVAFRAFRRARRALGFNVSETSNNY